MKRIFKMIAILLAGIGFVACSNKWEEEERPVHIEREGIPVRLKLDGESTTGETLRYNFYIFRKAAQDADYAFEQMLALKAGEATSVKFMNQDLKVYSYRFLFTATVDKRPEISVVPKSGARLTKGMAWKEITLKAIEDSLTLDNYYTVVDKTGDEILGAEKIEGILGRLVGRFLFDFYRVGKLGLEEPMDIVSPQVTSVLDRVFRIDILYSGLTKSLQFNDIVGVEPVSPLEGSFTQQIELKGENPFLVEIPQPEKGLEAAGVNTKGSVRIQGIYGLPSDDSVKVTMVFHYYDTTPKCENNHGTEPHKTDCYVTKKVTLNLFKAAIIPGLPVKADHFTLNRSGLPCDRIIDIKQQGNLAIDINWDNIK